MLTLSARFETPNASRYLQQLCKHFGHKVAVEYDTENGRADLPPGPAQMKADATGLDVTISAEDATGLERAKFIIEDHLKRFAFREGPVSLLWT
ncbi:DUF2218 domain-containing protein [Rhodobacteraceae bacterium NNCM2]|nr:DUF2218 domain-containing protein [Coraliihabitans acroporae]